MSTIKQKREFLSRILYDNQAWELPDERIIAAYCAYNRIPQAIEEIWIECNGVEFELTGKIEFTKLETQFGMEEVDGMSVRDAIKAEAKLEQAEREYLRVMQSAKNKTKRTREATEPKLMITKSVNTAIEQSHYICYFFFGDEDTILYIGKTNNFNTRWSDHVKTKDISRVKRIELHTFDSHPDVMFYETQMILVHQPEWNKRDTEGRKSKLSMEPLEILHIDIKQPTFA